MVVYVETQSGTQAVELEEAADDAVFASMVEALLRLGVTDIETVMGIFAQEEAEEAGA